MQIIGRGRISDVLAFTQHYGTDVLDFALPLTPLAGLNPREPVWLATLGPWTAGLRAPVVRVLSAAAPS